MEKSYVVCQLTEEEVKEHLFRDVEGKTNLYDFLREEFGKSSECTVNCSKILVSEDIWNYWFEEAEEVGINMADLSMALLFAGPKVTKSIEERQVLLYNGFFGEE